VFPAWLTRASRWNVAIAIYAVVSVAAVAGVLFSHGTLGHHWDWIVPSDPAELRQLAYGQAYAWQDYDFGSFVTYRYATILMSLLFGAPGFLGLTGEFVSKGLVLTNIFASAIAMRFLLLTLASDRDDPRDGIAATLCGLLYALAPYAYNQIISGDQSALISDALSPLAIALALRGVRATGRVWIAYALGSALTFAVILASVQVFVFAMAVAWIVCLTVARSWRTPLRLVATTAATIALCSYWFVPAAGAGRTVQAIAQTSPVDTAVATFMQFSNPLLTLTMVAFPGDFYQHALVHLAALFFLAYALLLALVVTALVRRPSAIGIVLSIVFVLTAFVPLGGNPIVGAPIIFAFKALLPYSLFLRTPQHLMFVGTLVVPILVYLAARSFVWRTPAVWTWTGVAIVICFGQGFFLHSNFFGLIGPFRESDGEVATVSIAQQPSSHDFRTMYVPASPGYYYHPGIFDYYFESSDEPQIRFLPGITMGAGVKWTPYERTQELLQALDEQIPDGGTPSQQRMLLKMTAVKNLIVHSIGVPNAGIRMTEQNARPYLESAMRRGKVATMRSSLDDRSVWGFDSAVQQAYSPDCVLYAPSLAGVYEVLGLADATATCARPAVLASADPAQWSETVIPAGVLLTRPGTVPLRLQDSDLPLDGSSATGWLGNVPPQTGDDETFRLPRVPKGATGFGFRIYSSVPRRVYVEILAPDEDNYFITNVDIGETPLDSVLDFNFFGKSGNPAWKDATAIRFSSNNAGVDSVGSYVGGLHWTYRRAYSGTPSYFAAAGNRFDPSYYGRTRSRVVFVASAPQRSAFAWFRIRQGGVYEISALVQDVDRSVSLLPSLDGHSGICVVPRTHADISQRLVRLMRASLAPGRHVVGIRFCGKLPSGPTAQGVLSLVIAAARMQPPAQRVASYTEIMDEQPGEMRVRTNGMYLVWTDSFDDRWKAAQDGQPLDHVIANGYANAWRVAVSGGGDVVMTFEPQRSLDIGIALSLAFLLLAIAGIVATSVPWRGRGAKIPATAVERPAEA
jgi:hypothetical protein